MNRRVRLIVALLTLLIPTFAHAAPTKAEVKAALNVDQLPADSTAAIAVTIDIPEGLHSQSSKPLEDNLIPLTLKLKDGPAKLANVAYPEAHIETYPGLGKVSVYTGKITVYAVVTVPKDAAAGPAKINGTVRYQLCNDSACFAPVTHPFAIDTTVSPAGTATTPANTELFAAMDPALLKASATTIPPPTQEETPIAGVPVEKPDSVIYILSLSLLVGLIFNVMPCVLPVLPLKAIGFYEASHHQRGKTIAFGGFFSLGVIAVFGILATFLLAGKSIIGYNIQWGELFAYPAFVWPMVAILLVLGLWLMGAFGVNLPTSIYGLDFRHDTYTGNFLWGGLTAILSTPCTAPLFPLILAWAVTQPLALGFTAMIFVGIGMALPYLVLSAFPEIARRFPRTGPFAEIFKQMMAFLVLGTAAFLLGTRLVGDPNQWWLVYAVAIGAAAFLIVRTRQLIPSPRATVVACVIALILTGGGFAVARDLAKPAKGFIHYTPQAFEEARKSGDIVLVKFTASWCLNCKYVEQTVFHNDATLEVLRGKRVRLLKADLTDRSDPGWDLLNQLGQSGIPFTAVYPPKSDKPLTLASIYTKDTLLATVDKAK